MTSSTTTSQHITSTGHTVNNTAPSPTEAPSSTSSHLGAFHVDPQFHKRAPMCTGSTSRACEPDAHPTELTSASCQAVAKQGNGMEGEGAPAASIAVQWSLLGAEEDGGSLGDRLMGDFQLGPRLKNTHMKSVGFTPKLNGRAAFMVCLSEVSLPLCSVLSAACTSSETP